MLRVLSSFFILVFLFSGVCFSLTPAGKTYKKKPAAAKKAKPKAKAKSTAKPKVSPPKPKVVTEEAVTKEMLSTAEVEGSDFTGQKKFVARYKKVRFEIGASAGFFSGITALLVEARVPLKPVIGAATTSFRFSAGLGQNNDANMRFVPANFDLLLNFPPGWLTGVRNYLGFGVNYLVMVSGKGGTFGGELIYGVESEGFEGVVFGEVGFASLQTTRPSTQRGLTVLAGYRHALGY